MQYLTTQVLISFSGMVTAACVLYYPHSNKCYVLYAPLFTRISLIIIFSSSKEIYLKLLSEEWLIELQIKQENIQLYSKVNFTSPYQNLKLLVYLLWN